MTKIIIGKQRTIKTTMTIPLPLVRLAEIKAEAEKQGLTMSQYVRRTVFADLDRKK